MKTIEEIERIDRRRYRLNLWRGIALVLFVGGVLAQMIWPDSGAVWFVYGLGAGLTCIVNGAFLGVAGMIRRDPELNEALNNEVFVHFTRQSVVVGFYAAIASGLILGVLTWHRFFGLAIPAEVCCLTIIFCGIVAQTVALLVYDRER